MTRTRRELLITSSLLVALTACGKKQTPPPAAPPPAASPASTPGDGGAAERAAREAEAAELARRREGERVRAVLEARVFFDYDEAEIRADARGTLDEKVRVLRDNPAIRLRVEGHADERGSTEYNLALGSRRAQSVVSYFTGFGMPAGRFETTSFGEERPLANGHDETAWGQNRRAEFAIVAGAPTTTSRD